MLTVSYLPYLPLSLLLLLSHLPPTTALYRIDCARPPGPPVPLADCLDVLPRIPPATLIHDDFLRPITFQSGHCAIAVARDPPDTTIHPPHHVIPAMRDIVWPDVRYMAHKLVQKCVKDEMGQAGMVLGCSYVEGLWYGYSVKVKFLPPVPIQGPLGSPPPGLRWLGSPPRLGSPWRSGSPPRSDSDSSPRSRSPPRPRSPLRPDPPTWTSSDTSLKESEPGGPDEWKRYLA